VILALVRELTDWLNDGTNGVVAQLSALPRDVGDSAPTVGTIADETRNSLVAQGRLPTTPGMSVNALEGALIDNQVVTATGEGRCTVAIRWGVSNEATKDASRDGAYVLRAIIKSVRLFNHDNRTRNSIQMYVDPDVPLHARTLWQTNEDSLVTCALSGQWICRDLI
jgi:hypothetical protein